MQKCVRTLQDGLWFVVAVCAVLEESSWRATGSSVRLRSDLGLFVPGCRSLPECLHLYRPVRVKDQTVSITRETCPVCVFSLRAVFIFHNRKIGKLTLSVPIVSESSFGN